MLFLQVSILYSVSCVCFIYIYANSLWCDNGYCLVAGHRHDMKKEFKRKVIVCVGQHDDNVC